MAIIFRPDGVLILEYSDTVGIRFVPDQLILIDGFADIDYGLGAFVG